MKIAFVLDDGLDSTDGVQQYVLTLGQWLARHGHTVHYLVGQTTRTDIPSIHSLSRNIAVRFNQNKLTIPLGGSKRRISKILQAEQYDVLHVQIPYSPQFAAKVIKQASDSTAVVGTFHILPYSSTEKHGSRLLGKVLKSSLKRFDEVLSVSEAAQEFALSSYGLDSQVIPNVVDVKRFRFTRKFRHDQKLQVVFLGRLVARKGALEFVRALGRLSAELLSQMDVYVGGTGSQRKQLEKEIDKQQLGHVVQLSGFIPEEQKADFLARSDIAVFPATGGESFGIVLLEAMAAGAGVVMGGDNPGYRSVLGSWPQTLLDVSHPDTFASQLEHMIQDKALRQRLHQEQQRAVEAYDVPRVGRRILNVYQAAIEKRAASAHT